MRLSFILSILSAFLSLPSHGHIPSQDEGSTTRMVYEYDASGNIVRRTAVAEPEAYEFRSPPAERKLTVGKGGVTVSAISTDGKLTVTLPPGVSDTPSSLHIYSASGGLVMSRTWTGGACKVDTRAMGPGVYLLRITSASVTYTEKIVIR